VTTTTLAIIGAGLAGVTAARVAHEAGIRPLVLEAGAQAGGRIEAERDAAGRVIADLGPSWVWPPFQPVVQHWLERLGLTTFPQHEAGEAVLDGFGPTPRRHALPGQYGMVRIAGGPSALVTAMAASMPEACFRWHARVNAIEQRSDGRLGIAMESGGDVVADQVLIAVPPRLISERIALPAGLSPALEAALTAQPTWMAAQAKAVIRYATPFWRDAGLSGRIASRVGPLFEAHDHTSPDGDAALFGFLSTPPGARDPSVIEPAIIEQLRRCLGPPAATPQRITVRDWAIDPRICSSRDYREPPAHPSVGPAMLRSPHLDGRLWLCGAETADQSPGLIEGALIAGERTARAALDRGVSAP
jgi:monoamine oxidase